MENSTQIIVVGSHAPGFSMRVPRPPKIGETVIGWDFQQPMDGGKGSNQAIAASRLGARVSFVGCLGRDVIGNEGKRWMTESGVDVSWLKQIEGVSTGAGFILLDTIGDCALVTSMGANANLTSDYVEQAISNMPSASIVITQFEIPPQVAMHAVEVAHKLKMKTILNPAPVPDDLKLDMQSVSILIPNEIEAKMLLKLDEEIRIQPSIIAEMLFKESGAECVIITLGEKGVVGYDAVGSWMVEPTKVSLVDALGAGDEFCAALSVGIVNGKNIREASRWASAVAALSVTKQGTIPAFPTLAEVQEFLSKNVN